MDMKSLSVLGGGFRSGEKFGLSWHSQLLGLISLLWISLVSAQAVVIVESGTYNTNDPNWSATSGGTSAWNYVGTVNGCSAVYLGNGWVISAAHVGVTTGNTYTLGGVDYTVTNTSMVATGVDLVMFQLSSTPDLTALTLGGTLNLNRSVYMIGYGDADGAGGLTTTETWGTSSVADNSYTLSLDGYTSTDFVTASTTYQTVNGDSGGAGFIYNSGTGTYSLVGITNASGSSSGTYYTYFVSLNSYLSIINGIKAVPEPTTYAFMAMGAAMILVAARKQRRSTR